MCVWSHMATQGLPQWSATMDNWGGKLLGAVTAVSRMAALGFGLPAGWLLLDNCLLLLCFCSLRTLLFGCCMPLCVAPVPVVVAAQLTDYSPCTFAKGRLLFHARSAHYFPADAFSSRMSGGPHLLAPTGSDLVKHGGAGTVLAGFHYDLNFITVSSLLGLCCWGFTGVDSATTTASSSRGGLTACSVCAPSPRSVSWVCRGAHCLVQLLSGAASSCCAVSCVCHCCLQIHGKSRFPGLSVWLADGTRCPVSIPQGCLLCQVGA